MSVRRYHRIVLLLIGFLATFAPARAHAQIPGLPAATAPAASQPSAPADPLKRETPRGALLGFIKAAGETRYSTAVQYFQPQTARHRSSNEDEQELAEQLFDILSRKIVGTLDSVSGEPAGHLDDGLPADQEKVGGTPGFIEDFPIYLVRLEDEQGRKLWYISRKTLEQVPHAYDALEYPAVERVIPQYLINHRFLAMPLWQWLAILLLVPVAWFIARVITLIGHALLGRWRKYRNVMLPAKRKPFFSLDPITLAIAILIHYAFVTIIGTSILYRLYYRPVIFILFAAVVYWILASITNLLAMRVNVSLTNRGLLAERSVVSLFRRFVDIVIFLFVSIYLLRSLGVNVTAALAGVGIGGLALGLGAQKTFENVFGGVSILFDKVIRVGDVCKINNQTGTVEDIGLRSTRLRTAERTILSIPNGIMATSTIENLRFRDKFLCQQIVRLRYDLAPEHVRFVLDEMREILRRNDKVEEPSARVRFIRFADYALEVEIYCYILESDFAVYLKEQEALLLEMMDALEKAGAVVALPSQTTLVTKDAWVDPEKLKQLQSAIQKSTKPDS